jgi:pimeloyl-ACP methyl ester carboxylesterase
LALRDPNFQRGGSGGPFDGWAALAGLEVPTLIIRATGSLAADEGTVARVANELSRASYTEIDSGHDLANEAPAELVAAIRRFLA